MVTEVRLDSFDVVDLADILHDCAGLLFARFSALHSDFLTEDDNRAVIAFKQRLDREVRSVGLNDREALVALIEKYSNERQALLPPDPRRLQ